MSDEEIKSLTMAVDEIKSLSMPKNEIPSSSISVDESKTLSMPNNEIASSSISVDKTENLTMQDLETINLKLKIIGEEIKRQKKNLARRIELCDDDYERLEYVIDDECWLFLAPMLPKFINPIMPLSSKHLRMCFLGIVSSHKNDTAIQIENQITAHWMLHPPDKEGMHNVYTSFLLDDLVEPKNEYRKDISCLKFWSIHSELEQLLFVEKEQKQKKASDERKLLEAEKKYKEAEDIFNKEKDNQERTENELFSLRLSKNNAYFEYLQLRGPIALAEAHEQLDILKKFKLGNRVLPLETRIKRYLLIYKSYLDLLHLDFLKWNYRVSNNCEVSEDLLISKLFPTRRTRRKNDPYCNRVIKIFCNSSTDKKCHIARFIALLAEAAKVSSNSKNIFIDINIEQFAMALANSVCKSQNVTSETVNDIKLLKPAWFQRKVATYVIDRSASITSVKDLTNLIYSNLRYEDSSQLKTGENKNACAESYCSPTRVSRRKRTEPDSQNVYAGGRSLDGRCANKKPKMQAVINERKLFLEDCNKLILSDEAVQLLELILLSLVGEVNNNDVMELNDVISRLIPVPTNSSYLKNLSTTLKTTF